MNIFLIVALLYDDFFVGGVFFAGQPVTGEIIVLFQTNQKLNGAHFYKIVCFLNAITLTFLDSKYWAIAAQLTLLLFTDRPRVLHSHLGKFIDYKDNTVGNVLIIYKNMPLFLL